MEEQTKKNQYGDSSEPVRDFPDVLPVKRMDEVIKTNEPLTDLNSASSPIYKDIQSTNYSPGSKGWRLRANGDSELNQNADAVDTSATSAGSMYKTGSQSVPTSTDTKITINNITVEEDILCDTTNNRIEILTDGTYFIQAQVGFYPGTANKIVNCDIYVNGSFVAQGNQETGTATAVAMCSTSHMATLDVGDYVELYAFHNFGFGAQVQGTDLNTFIHVFKI